MADPIINEFMILGVLDAKASEDTIDQLQYGAVLSTMDAFDRKIERRPFMEVAATSYKLHSLLARLASVADISRRLKDNLLTPESLDETMKQIAGAAEWQRVALMQKMNLVAQCPKTEDTIH